MVWEVRPVPAPSLPTSFTDLLLVGSRGSGVAIATPRPSTGTPALSFTGGSSSVVTVPSALTPYIVNNISISVWFIFNGSVNGVLVGSANGSTVYYGLALVSDNNQYIIRLLYLPSTLNVSIIDLVLCMYNITIILLFLIFLQSILYVYIIIYINCIFCSLVFKLLRSRSQAPHY